MGLNFDKFLKDFYSSLFVSCSKSVNDEILVDYFKKFNQNTKSTTPLLEDIRSLFIENVKSINRSCFLFFPNLENLFISKNVDSIQPYISINSYKNNLQKIQVDENNKIYDSRANCNAIINSSTQELLFGCKTTKIPDGVLEISHSAFKGCERLKSILFPNSVKAISNEAFYGCKQLIDITFGSGLTIIHTGAFNSCSSIKKILFPKNLEIIGESAFGFCDSLQAIEFSPDSKISEIKQFSFLECNNLKEVEIPKTVTFIGTRAFGYRLEYAGIVKNEDFIIKGCKNSEAEKYAIVNDFKFISID